MGAVPSPIVVDPVPSQVLLAGGPLSAPPDSLLSLPDSSPTLGSLLALIAPSVPSLTPPAAPLPMAGPSFPASLGGRPAIPPGGTVLPAIRSPSYKGWHFLVQGIGDQPSELDRKEKLIERMRDNLATMADVVQGKDVEIKRLREGLGPDIESLKAEVEIARGHAQPFKRALKAAGIVRPRSSLSPPSSPLDHPVTTVGVEGPPEPQVPPPSLAPKRAEQPTPTPAGRSKRSRPSGGRSGSPEGGASGEEVGTASGA